MATSTTIKVDKKMVKGLSNIVGSLLLVTLTIVAALLVGHFVFGLFSAQDHIARISITDASMIIPGGNFQQNGGQITFTVTNTGTDPVIINYVWLNINDHGLPLFDGTFNNPYGLQVVSGAYEIVPGKGILLEPGQSISLSSGLFPQYFNEYNVPSLQVGQTVVLIVSAIDNMTAQTIATQTSIVVQD